MATPDSLLVPIDGAGLDALGDLWTVAPAAHADSAIEAEPVSPIVDKDTLEHLPLCACGACTGNSDPLTSGFASTDIDGAPVAGQAEYLFNTPQAATNAVLTQNTQYQWHGSTTGQALVLNYSFATQFPYGYDSTYSASSWSAFTTKEQVAVRQILSLYAEVANVTFNEVAYNHFDPTPMLFGGNVNMGNAAAVTWMYSNGSRLVYADIFVDDNYASPDAGDYDYLALIHEIGHGLGLKHPGNYNAGGGGADAPYLTSYGLPDTRQYTVMSYNEHGAYGSLEPLTPMLLDIAAIQFLYGARTSFHAGNDTYTFATSTQIKTIWDGGGIDTFDLSNQSGNSQVNLDAGSFSSIAAGAGNNNIAIAYGVTIENAVGGSGRDEIIGNAVGNRLAGGGGNDSLSSGDGLDSLFGDTGNDTLLGENGTDLLYGGAGDDLMYGGADDDWAIYYSSTSGRYQITLQADNSVLVKDTYLADGDNGTDTLSGIEYMMFDDRQVDTASLLPGLTINGSTTSEFLAGAATADTIYGAAGDDTINGGLGIDYLYGGEGNDLIIGGGGTVDYAVFAGNRSDYLINGFGGQVIVNALVGAEGTDTLSGTSLKFADQTFRSIDAPTLGVYADDATVTEGDDGHLAAVFNVRLTIAPINEVRVGYSTANHTATAGTDYVAVSGTLVFAPGETLKTVTVSVLSDTAYERDESFGLSIDQPVGADRLALGAAGLIRDNDVGLLVGTDLVAGAWNGMDWIRGSSAPEQISGLSGDDTLEGLDGNDTLYGGSGSDSLRAGLGDDELYGGAENDRIDGDFGNDYIEGGAGADTLIGGLGADTAAYRNSAQGVSVNLTTGLGSGGDAAGDSYDGIEYARGSDFADTLIGDGHNNWTAGYAGNDSIQGHGGDDRLLGGAGNDTVDGGAGADGVFGDAGDDEVYGGGGNDTVDGGAGNDFFEGGSGADQFFGGAGADTAAFRTATAGVAVNLLVGTGSAGDAAGDTYNGIEYLRGSDFSDTLAGDNLNNWMAGYAGNDNIAGDGGDDWLLGGAGNDTVDAGIGADGAFGEAGDDELLGGAGADSLDGGDGNDYIEGGSGADTLIGGLGADTAAYRASVAGVNVNLLTGIGSGGDAAGDTYNGIEYLRGSDHLDTLAGDNQNNWMAGYAGNDSIIGNGGDDWLLGGAGNDTIDAGSGADGAFGDAGDDSLAGGAGNDSLDGGDGNDTVEGGAGIDTLFGGNGADLLSYAAASAAISVNLLTGLASLGDAAGDIFTSFESAAGSAFADTLTGDNASNQLLGNGGDDTLAGNGGDDDAYGGAGADVIDGGAGNDYVEGGSGADALNGGNGYDTAAYRTSTLGVNVNLVTGVGSGGDAAGDTYTGIEYLRGSDQGDTLAGDHGNNWMAGYAGDDSVSGGTGEDWLLGGAGNDTVDGGDGADGVFGDAGDDMLVGGNGADTLTGGTGADTFLFTGIGPGVDTITDFTGGSGGDQFGFVLSGYTGLNSGVTGANALYGAGVHSTSFISGTTAQLTNTYHEAVNVLVVTDGIYANSTAAIFATRFNPPPDPGGGGQMGQQSSPPDGTIVIYRQGANQFVLSYDANDIDPGGETVLAHLNGVADANVGQIVADNFSFWL